MRKIFLSVLLLMAACSVQALDAPLWLRNAVISPEGASVAFTYKGDLFTVPITGGRAVQLTSHSSYDTKPVWSPGGDKLAFASNREGSFDVYVVTLSTGEAKRVTYHSANEYPEVFKDDNTLLFSSYIQPAAESQQFPLGLFSQLYAVTTEGGRPQLFPTAYMENISPKGNQWLYTDRKGYEDVWRKHHTSSVTRDVWLFDTRKGTHVQGRRP